MRNAYEILMEDLGERNYFGYLDILEKIILKWILEKQCEVQGRDKLSV
jgi:hypothetical protein